MEKTDQKENGTAAEKAVGAPKLTTSRKEEALKTFFDGYNCAQAVFATYADLFGIDRQTALCLTNSMGGGIARLREVCGTVSAMALLAGLSEGEVAPGDLKARELAYQKTRDLAARFEKENGSIICRELLGILSREKSAMPSERTPEYYQKRPCAKFVACAANIIEEELLTKQTQNHAGKEEKETT